MKVRIVLDKRPLLRAADSLSYWSEPAIVLALVIVLCWSIWIAVNE